jgi:L-alanine-DL-glutamate epimerase-like enolase superfamily enzyme
MPVPAAADVVGETRSAPIIKQVVAQVLRLPEVDGQKGDSGQDTLVVRVITECGLVVRARPGPRWLPRVLASGPAAHSLSAAAACRSVTVVHLASMCRWLPQGFGEVEAQPEIAKAIIDAPRSWGGKKIGASGLRAELIGENALDHERLWNKMYDASSFYGRHAVVIQAMAGVDMALWDLKGKFLQLPLYQLLGGKTHDKLRAYASTLFGDTPEETAARGEALVEAGYTAVKVRRFYLAAIAFEEGFRTNIG